MGTVKHLVPKRPSEEREDLYAAKKVGGRTSPKPFGYRQTKPSGQKSDRRRTGEPFLCE